MACVYSIGPVKKDGKAPIFIRVQSKKLKVNIQRKVGLSVLPSVWKMDRDSYAFKKYKTSEEGRKLFGLLDDIEFAINSKLGEGIKLASADVQQIVENIIYKDAIEEQKRIAAEEEEKSAAANRMTLNKFIEAFRRQIQDGSRQTEQGKNYAPGTVKAINAALNQFVYFQQDTGREYDFNDIDMQFYYDFTAYLKKKNYAINTVGKCVKELKAIMYCAETEGYHTNGKYKDKKFKGTRVEVDSIYLTKEDLEKIMAANLSEYGKGHELARDIFMVGVWTAQRVSDYNNINRGDINTLTKNIMHEDPDPDNPGETIAWIEKKVITYINIRQKKTGAKVAVPCSSDLKNILEKYDYQIPHIEDQVLNRYLKDICKTAGLTERVLIETTKGGTPIKEEKEKWELVHTHTARRTGATLMYLSGMELFDIMKITGHSSPMMLKKYIKADQLEVVSKITDKYRYFD